MKPSEFLSIEQKTRITEAIKAAELDTSGEIRLHIESSCSVDILDRAAYIFSHLDMHKTKERNGVLFYLALDNHQFAILGDAGINHKVPANFWDTIKETMLADFKDGKMADGIEKGIRMAGEQLKAHFPYQSDDVNELSDEISYGK